MANLFEISTLNIEATAHVIFIHGLNGHHYTTWGGSYHSQVFWPAWLATDIEGLAVWTVGYDAAISRWHGSAMHLIDRATNVLERILLEPKLQTGDIILIGHSFGGLVIKQLLRTAESMSYQRTETADFLKRVHRVAFLATPHLGVDAATWADRLRIFVKPSAATACLVRNDRNLHDLNLWYRDWSVSHSVTHRIFMETQSIRIAGFVVKPDSSDPGLSQRPITIDADHFTICKPEDRSSEIYLHIRKFVTYPLETSHHELAMEASIKNQSVQLEALIEITKENNFRVGHIISSLNQTILDQTEKTADLAPDGILAMGIGSESSFYKKYPKDLVDSEIQKNLSLIRRARSLSEFSTTDHSIRLAEKIRSGEFHGGSDDVRSNALAWCVRFLALGENNLKCNEFLNLAKQLGNGPEVTIAEAFRIATRNDLEGALGMLASIKSATSHSAALRIIANQRDACAAISWLSKVGLTYADLDADGKVFFVAKSLELCNWDIALACIRALNEEEYDEVPLLYWASALTYLVQVIPDDLKSQSLQQVPFEAKNFPLASTHASIQLRREAQEQFSKFAFAAKEIHCINAANIAEDYALWLELLDPERSDSGRKKLQLSMSDPLHSLRRVHLALQFNLPLDIDAVEREIERQSALSGGNSADAAMARFALAFAQESPKAVADYIDRHRAQLLKHVERKCLNAIEIEMLARAGSIQKAEECFMSLITDGLSEAEQIPLRRVIEKSTGTDPLYVCEAQYESSGALTDLIILVDLLEEQNDWKRLCHFGSLLLEKTQALPNAVRLATALQNENRGSELIALLKKYPEFLEQSDNLLSLWSWSLYREGLLIESALVLKKLQAKRDHPNDRALRVNLEIASGAWADLLLYVHDEWTKRDMRKTDELIRTAQLAQFVKSPYAKDLVYFAADKGNNNAHILLAAYSLATNAGWEDDVKVGEWLREAANLSDDSGPIKNMSLTDILDRKTEWDRRETEIWQKIHEGSAPIFAAAHLLNRSLIDMYLLPALANPFEQDLRRRGLVPAYSGARQSLSCNYRVVAMEATTLLTLAVLELLEKARDAFDVVVIPHSTLGWLFEEKQKASFHQPSRIKNASKLRNMLATGLLKELTESTDIDGDLAAEVGIELASLIAEAQVSNDGDKRQRLVVRSLPVFKIDSLMEEEADLSLYHSHLCSCIAVVNKLKQKGQLTAIEEHRARDYLSFCEKEWPDQPELSDGVVLYLDSLSVTYLQHTGLLGKLKPAGIEGYISGQEIAEINGLLRYEQLGTEVNEIIECIRSFLEAGIQTGKIKVGRIPDLAKIEELPVQNHPTLTVLDLGKDVEAIFIDDRGINQHSNIDTVADHTPILTTLDMIDALYSKQAINLDQRFDYRTKLRQAGYLFVAITKNELEHHLSHASVIDDCVVETAELKAIRENILMIRMSRFLQLPKESSWLSDLMQAFVFTLKAQWHPKIDEVTANARSEWLLQCLDIRGWAQCFVGNESINMTIHGRSAQIMSLLLAPPDLPAEIKEKYWTWIEKRLLLNIQEEDPDLYSRILERARDFISYAAEADLSKENE